MKVKNVRKYAVDGPNGVVVQPGETIQVPEGFRPTAALVIVGGSASPKKTTKKKTRKKPLHMKKER